MSKLNFQVGDKVYFKLKYMRAKYGDTAEITGMHLALNQEWHMKSYIDFFTANGKPIKMDLREARKYLVILPKPPYENGKEPQ